MVIDEANFSGCRCSAENLLCNMCSGLKMFITTSKFAFKSGAENKKKLMRKTTYVVKFLYYLL